MIYTVLAFSVVVNGILGWYARELLKRFKDIGDLAKDLDLSLEHYQEHLTNVYELETYYGDETLTGLLRHIGDLKKEIEDYRTIFIFEEDLQVGENSEQEKEES